MFRKIEAVANISIIAVAAMAFVTLLGGLQNPSASAGTAARPVIALGTSFPLAGVDWATNKSTLVLVLNSGCHFCTESAGFYKRLSEQLPARGVHLVAVLPQSQKEGQAYLQTLGVPISDVRHASFSALKVAGTPTLVLVDNRGVVRHVWTGKLQSEDEEEVIQRAATM